VRGSRRPMFPDGMIVIPGTTLAAHSFAASFGANTSVAGKHFALNL